MKANDSLKMDVMSESPESRMARCLYSNFVSSISGSLVDTFSITSISHFSSHSMLVAWYSEPRYKKGRIWAGPTILSYRILSNWSH